MLPLLIASVSNSLLGITLPVPSVQGFSVTVAAGVVSETLTDFPLRIHLRDMPPDFWTGMDGTGSDIRVYADDGVTLIPHDVAYIDPVSRQGDLYCKVTVATAADTTVIVRRDGVGGALAVGAPNGRNAVWSDYEVVWSFPSGDNRTGNTYTQDLSRIEPHYEWFREDYRRLTGDPHQGIAADALGNFVSFDTNYLRKMDSSFAVVASNADPLGDTGIAGVNHVGDGCIIGNEIFTVVELYTNNPYNNQHICVFNLSDLSFNRSYDISAQGHEVSSICYDGTDLWITDFTIHTLIHRYSITGVFIESVTLSSPIVNMQGIERVGSNFYITTFASSHNIYEVEPDGTVLGVVYSAPENGELEGLAYDGTMLYVLDEAGDLMSLSTGQHGGFRKAHRDYGTVTLPRSQVFTASATANHTVTDEQFAFLGVGNGSDFNNSAALLYDNGPDRMDVWDSSGSWLAPTLIVKPLVGDTNRFAFSYNGTAGRKLWVDGVLLKHQTSIAARPAGAGTNMDFNLNSSRSNGTEIGEAHFQFVWLRADAMSDGWMEADYANSLTPASFYTIAATGQNTGVVPDYAVMRQIGPDLNFHQGIVAQSNGYILVDSNQLTRYNLDWEQQTSNTNPMGDISAPGNLTDMFEYDSSIWAVRSNNGTTDTINAWDSTTMAYQAGKSVPFSAGPSFVGFSCACTGPTTGYLYGVSESASVIEIHDMSTGAYVGEISIGGTLSECNGIHFSNGFFYFACRPNKLYRCAAAGGDFTEVLTFGFTKMDGLSGKGDDLYLLSDGTLPGQFKISLLYGDVAQTSTQSSGEILVNGDAETQSVIPWRMSSSTSFTVIYGGAVGPTPDSYIFRGTSGGYMWQSYEIPQEAWDQVDVGNATVDFSCSQFGSGNGTPTITFFDANHAQLGQALGTSQAPGFGAWITRSVTGFAVPANTRSFLVQIASSNTNVYFDNISCNFNW